MLKYAVCALAAASLAPAAQAATVFDFENLATGQYTTASQTKDGLTLTINRLLPLISPSFNVYNIGNRAPAFGNRSIGTFEPGQGGINPFTFDFSAPITSFSMQVGDFGADIDALVLAVLPLFGNGLQVGAEVRAFYNDSLPNTATLSFSSALPFRNLTFLSEGLLSLQMSVYFDNISVTPFAPPPPGGAVPEPATWAMMIAGFGLAGAAMRRKRAARVTFA